jgi:ketosteroid isomerase-like protein
VHSAVANLYVSMGMDLTPELLPSGTADSKPVADAAVVTPAAPAAAVAATVANATPAAAPVDTAVLARTFVEDWFNAWQAQDVTGYFSHYADDFVPANDQAPDAWRSQRERNITRHDSISIELESFTSVAETGDSVTVEFDMHFTAPTYQDRTRKQVVLRREDDMLSILAESNLSVQVL